MQARIEAILKRREEELFGVLTDAEQDDLAGILDKLTRHAAALGR